MSPRWFGRLIESSRSDASLSAWNILDSPQDLTLSSPAFDDGSPIPQRHAGKGVGDNISPALSWSGVPVEADHLVLVIEDVDVPFSRPLIHTMAVLDPGATGVAEGSLVPGAPGIEYLRTLHGRGYHGPRPIVGHGEHRYRFMLFAVEGDIDMSSTRAALESMVGAVVARGRVVGTYER